VTTRSEPKFTRAGLLQILASAFQARGGEISPILQRNGIPEAALTEPDRLVEASAFYAACEDMATALGDRYFCAEIAREAARRGEPTLRDAVARAGSLGDFLVGAVLETSRRFDNVVYSLRMAKEAAIFQIRRTRRITLTTTQADAVGIAFYVTLLRQGLGEVFDPNRMLVAAHSIDGVPPDIVTSNMFVRSTNVALSLTFPADWLLAPFAPGWIFSDGQTAAPSMPKDDSAVLTFVRDAIRRNIADRAFDLDQLAALCSISRRRLQRTLASKGTSFRKMREAVRREIATELLARHDGPLRDVAWEAGLSGEAAFGRFYQRSTGEPPGAHRRRLRSAR